MAQTFTLATPVGEVTSITLDEPTVAEIIKLGEESAKHGSVRALVNLIASQAKIPAAEVQMIRARDFKAMERYLSSFFDEPPETSTT